MKKTTADQFVTRLLFVGLLAAMGWVVTALVRAPSHERLFAPAVGAGEVVASVNGKSIDRLRYDRALAALSLEERGPDLTPARRRQVLQALIDEELLLEQAARMNLHLDDRLIRRRLVNAMLDAFAARVDPDTLSERALRNYYEEHSALFAEADRVAVDAFFFRDQGRAQAAGRDLRRNDDRAVEALADRSAIVVPKGLLPRKTLENYLGPTASRAAEEAAVGEVTDPIRTAGGFWVIRVSAREPGMTRPFDEVRDAVASLVRRAETDRLLQAWLREARGRAEIIIAADADDPERLLSERAVQEVLRARMGEAMPDETTGTAP